jgi:multiple sugar transport system permease protein
MATTTTTATTQTRPAPRPAPTTPSKPKSVAGNRHWRRILLCFALVAPVVAIRLFTAGWPALDTAITSFQESSPTLGHAPTWIGLGNYERMWASDQVHQSLGFTILFAVASTVLELVLGMAIATVLNATFRFRRIVRAINLIPWAIPAVVAGIAFRFALDPDYGVIAGVLKWFGLDSVGWLVEPGAAQVAVIGTNVWRNAGFVAILLLAALKTIPDELYEAAQVDGAGRWQRFTRITLPLVMPIILSSGTFMMVWQISSFDLVLSLTGGGPGTATTVLGYQAYLDGFQGFDFGYSSAIAMVLLLFVAFFGILGSALRKRTEL